MQTSFCNYSLHVHLIFIVLFVQPDERGSSFCVYGIRSLNYFEMILESYGWQNFYLPESHALKNGLVPGRVVSIKGFKYYVITEKGELETELSGRLLHGAEPEELPKVGDWILLMDYESMGYIIEVLPRTNELSRKNPGTKTQRQVLATNVDNALVVQGLDRDYNIMRLERYLAQLLACNINSIVILNKSDLVDNPDDYRNEVLKLQRDCPVYFCSTYTGYGLESLRENVLEKYKTYVLIGSSGVGKSSLVNALLREEIQHTSDVSDVTGKGKHTTTTRDLFQLPNGSLLIDTPGMREFGFTFEDGQDSSQGLFPAIERLSQNCRFSDCRHLQENGCAVLRALTSGELDTAVYESYLKLMKEQKRFEISLEDKKRMNKQFGRMTREAVNYRKKNKY